MREQKRKMGLDRRSTEINAIRMRTNLLMDVGVANDRTELVERDLAILVFVGEQNGLIDDLL